MLAIFVLWAQPAWAKVEIAPSFLGMYRKTIEIDRELSIYTARYKVDPRTARAVVIQESGGNAHLVSVAGARGYFQVMPQTFRMLGVRTNIEAGIKYLAQLQRRFGREDYAVAAYNAGPGAVGGERPLRLETLQYVINVGHYKSVLRLHESEVRRQAEKLKLHRVRQGDSWETLARTTGVPPLVLRLYNPFLAPRPLQAGAFVAHPLSPPPDLLEDEGEALYYTSRIGDSYLNLALIFGVTPENFRRDNDLWRLQQLPVGVQLRVANPASSAPRLLQAVSKPSSGQVAAVTRQERTNFLPSAAQRSRTHKVRRGETLTGIARRYQTTVQSLMNKNGLRKSHIQAGTVLKIP
jgi:LysM repeat protein